MNLELLKHPLVKLYKIVSIALMSGAIALESYSIVTVCNQQPLSNFWLLLTIIASVAIIIHIGEAIVAGFLALNQGKKPIQSAIYVFFTGTVSLLELISLSPARSQSQV